MMMGMKGLIAAVVIACMAMVCVTILLALHVDPTAIISVISVVAVPIIGAVLYGKVDSVQQQTNGNQSRLTTLLESTVEHLKTHNTVPIPEAPPVESKNPDG